nr:hypothetical protein [Tanacetum cinerariifolium]
MTPKVNKGKRIATGDKPLPPKLVKASREAYLDKKEKIKRAEKEAELSKPKIIKVVAGVVHEAEVHMKGGKDFIKHQDAHLKDKLSVIISNKKNKVVCELMTSLSNKYERLKKILGELGLNLVIPKTYIVGLHCHTELLEGVKFVNNLVIEELDHGLFLIDALRDEEEMERLDRETSARVELINSQKVAEDLKVLQIDTYGMDPVDAATINAQKGNEPFLYTIWDLLHDITVGLSLGPLDLNKVITFEVLCRSLQIEPTVTLFRVFQTLCKQGDWFSFAKHRAPSPRHPDAGSFNMADVHRLSAHVIKLKDMPEGVLVLSGLSRVWKSHVCDLVLWVAMEMDLAVGTPSSKIFDKVKASQKQKASTSGATSSHVAKRTSDDDDDDDDDDCVEIPLITPLRSAVVIPSSGNHDSRGKGVMVDDVPASSGGDGVVGNCEFTREEWDAPYRPTFGVLTKVVFKDLAICKTIVDQFPTPVKMKFLASDEFSRVQGELLSLAASTGFKHGLSMHRTKDKFPAVLKKMISEYATEHLSVILQLEPEKLVRSANVPISRDARVSFPIANESTVTPASKSFELSANVDLTASVFASEHDEEMVRSGCVSSGPNDVVVALSAGEKGDGLTPSSVASEEAAINPSGV